MSPSLFWFRQDLRLADNPALVEAIKSGKIYACYILDDENAGPRKMGGASRYWLHHSLQALSEQLDGKINFYRGKADEIIPDLVERLDLSAVYWNRCYEPWRVARDQKIKTELADRGITAESHNGSLLWEPWEVAKPDGTPYRVFTPYYRKGCLNVQPPRPPLPAPDLGGKLHSDADSLSLDALDLVSGTAWHKKFDGLWPIGEQAAMERAADFIGSDIAGYRDLRDFPTLPHTSGLSASLHFGEISPHQLWAMTGEVMDDTSRTWASKDKDLGHFRSELGWREFSYYLNYHFKDMQQDTFNKKFDDFEWQHNEDVFDAWCKGETGIPIVDAGMRQLWQTGLMHNRVRMVVASFLVKNLLIDWRKGEQWFWDCLCDADSASNGASWQWVAGCGADAAPYFRIFNPVLQSQRFDPQGDYIKKYVPELAGLDGKDLYAPWESSPAILKAAGVTLDQTYPAPIVELKGSRERALLAYKIMREDQ